MLVTQMLWGSIIIWWVSASVRMTTQNIQKVWDRFKEVFLDKYFFTSLRSQKEFEFKQLIQESMSVEKYIEKFEDMAAHSRQAMYEPDKRWKIDQLLFRLRGR